MQVECLSIYAGHGEHHIAVAPTQREKLAANLSSPVHASRHPSAIATAPSASQTHTNFSTSDDAKADRAAGTTSARRKPRAGDEGVGPRRTSTGEPATGYGPEAIETKAIETEAIEAEDLEPRRIQLDRNRGTDPYQIQERLMRNNYRNPTAEDMDEFGKVGSIPIMTQREALQTRILNMENYEKYWLHHCICRVEGIANHLEYQLLRRSLLQ